MRAQRFSAPLQPASRGRAFVAVPFDPDQVWAPKAVHRVGGSINGHRIRAIIELAAGGWAFTLGAAWLRDCHGVAVGDVVTVELVPEGPQRGDLSEDFASALLASPVGGAFFDSLAQFYRRGYLRWIDATTRRPDERARRIAEVVKLLEAGVKERPKP